MVMASRAMGMELHLSCHIVWVMRPRVGVLELLGLVASVPAGHQASTSRLKLRGQCDGEMHFSLQKHSLLRRSLGLG